MQTGLISTSQPRRRNAADADATTAAPIYELARRPEESLAAGAGQGARRTATDFEAMFLNSMFSQMTSGLKGEGPFGDTPGTGVWRSMLTEQYSKSFAKAGGVGISNEVYRTLILQQAKRSRPDPRRNRHEPASATAAGARRRSRWRRRRPKRASSPRT